MANLIIPEPPNFAQGKTSLPVREYPYNPFARTFGLILLQKRTQPEGRVFCICGSVGLSLCVAQGQVCETAFCIDVKKDACLPFGVERILCTAQFRSVEGED